MTTHAAFRLIAIISTTAAVLCILALPVWVLGVPAVENQYARGWRMGLNALLVYPVVWFVNYAAYFLFRNRVSEQGRAQWQLVASALAVILVLAAVVRMVQAFRTMS